MLLENQKRRLMEYFNRNSKQLLATLKKHGEFIMFSKEKGYLYRVENFQFRGNVINLRVGLKSGKLNILDISLSGGFN